MVGITAYILGRPRQSRYFFLLLFRYVTCGNTHKIPGDCVSLKSVLSTRFLDFSRRGLLAPLTTWCPVLPGRAQLSSAHLLLAFASRYRRHIILGRLLFVPSHRRCMQLGRVTNFGSTPETDIHTEVGERDASCGDRDEGLAMGRGGRRIAEMYQLGWRLWMSSSVVRWLVGT